MSLYAENRDEKSSLTPKGSRANINFSVIKYLFQGKDHDSGDASPKDGAGQLTYYFAFPFFKFSSGALCNFNFQDFNPL